MERTVVKKGHRASGLPAEFWQDPSLYISELRLENKDVDDYLTGKTATDSEKMNWKTLLVIGGLVVLVLVLLIVLIFKK